ncbi:MAG: SH3 domain-containing protein [Lachnospiraceae bacterium]|nr:SH3 domain-containing protein [Lachnospiraceae bacterium]
MKNSQMKKNLIYTALSCCLAATIITTGFSVKAEAAGNEAEIPVAGMNVALNNYYARISGASQTGLETPVVGIPAEVSVEKVESEYENVAVSRCNDYVNVRSMPSTDGEIVGKIYDGCAATILERVGDWYKIESGSVEGYIKAEYFVTGEAAEALVDELAVKIGTVNTTTLFVRAGADINSDRITMVPLGEEFEIIDEENGWAKIEVDASASGWVSMDYLDIRVEFDVAISIEEEQRKIEEQEAAKRKAEEDLRAYQAAQAAQAEAERAAKEAQVQAAQQSVVSSIPANSSNAALREAIVSYALQFVGNPYVYGGNSLTNGTDCSGFVNLVYKEFGYSLTRRASLQYNDGRRISVDELQPGDLIFYPEPYDPNEIGHVAMYIGNGQVVHASTASTGIKISSYNYRTIYGCVSIID